MTAKKRLLKNVRPIDFPGYDGTKTLDVEIDGSAVARVGHDLEANGAAVRDFSGSYLSPAWVDMHTHIYWGGSDIALKPSLIGAATGAPILVDAGSAGEGHFLGFNEFIIKQARERIVPFLNVGSVGLVATNRVPEVRVLKDIDIERIVVTVDHYKPLIAGLKVRMCSIIHAETDLLPLKLAKKIARYLKLPLMAHIGQSLPLVEEVLDRLDKGDILTHCFHGKPASSVIDDDSAYASLVAAKKRGIVYDIGHGSASFSYRVARQCLESGIFPDTIGSDLHTGNVEGPVWDLSVVLSKMHSIGMTLSDVVAGAASAPRRALSMPKAALERGAAAEFTLFGVEDCAIDIPDSLGDMLTLTKRVLPRAVYWKGELSDAASRMPDGLSIRNAKP